MPRTVESIVQAHDTARARRAAGRPVWDYKLTVAMPRDASFEENRDRFASALHASRWFKERGADYGDPLNGLWDEIKDAEDVQHFDSVLDAIYDEADIDRCWISIQR